jgi:hypothetical protein
VPGERLVRLSQVGQILNLEVKPLSDATTPPVNWLLPIVTLPQLLTGGNGNNATGLTISNSGEVELTGSGCKVENDDIVAKNITVQTATLSANNNLTLVESQLATSGDLNLMAQNTVLMRDSIETLFDVQAGSELNIQGNQSVNILAINHANPALRSGGNLRLATNSDNGISADGYFISGGNFSIINLASGTPGNFTSVFDPIIKSNGNVSFGNYNGASLKIISSDGSLNIRNEDFTNQFESYFQRQSNAKIYTSKDIQDHIRQLEQATGVKTGVIYVRFIPSTVATPETACATPSLKTLSNKQDRRFGSLRGQFDAQQPECNAASIKQLEFLLISAEGKPIRQIIKDTTRSKVLTVTQEFQGALTNPKNVNTTSYLKSLHPGKFPSSTTLYAL